MASAKSNTLIAILNCRDFVRAQIGPVGGGSFQQSTVLPFKLLYRWRFSNRKPENESKSDYCCVEHRTFLDFVCCESIARHAEDRSSAQTATGSKTARLTGNAASSRATIQVRFWNVGSDRISTSN